MLKTLQSPTALHARKTGGEADQIAHKEGKQAATAFAESSPPARFVSCRHLQEPLYCARGGNPRRRIDRAVCVASYSWHLRLGESEKDSAKASWLIGER